MTKVTSKDAQNRFSELIDKAQREPVTIERRGRAVAVVVSQERYEALEALEDALWLARAKQAAEEGFIGTDETASFIRDMLNAEAGPV